MKIKREIGRWSYWFGMASAVIALVLRGLNMAGMLTPTVVVPGQTLWYMSFYKGALLFFLVAIASASYVWLHDHKE